MVDIMPFVSTIGGGFLAGALVGYALKKAMKIVAIILGLFIAALSYLEYQVDWDKLQTISQNAITWLANAITHISNNIGANHGVPTNLGTSNVIPLASSISAGLMLVRLRIGISELLAFHTAVSEKAEMHNMSMESAAYRVIEDIQYYNRLGGMKKELSYVSTKVFAMNQLSGRQNNAVMALIRLQSQGVTEDQILRLHNSMFDVKDRTI
jgi:uncharacterized membrane protein (Fun14 family)